MQRRGWIGGLAVFGILVTAYLLTFRGLPFSKDELFIYDSTESLARRGYLARTFEYDQIKPAQVPPSSSDEMPWLPPAQEPLAIVLGVPFFWLGEHLPDLGMMHSVWLMNVIMTAAVGASLYAVVLRQGYRFEIALAAALVFGLGTNAWAFSRHLFREPTMTLMVLWSFALALEINTFWQKNRIPYVRLSILAVVFAAALLTKSASILIAPALLIILVPPRGFILRHWRRILMFGLAGLLLTVAVFLLMQNTAIANRYTLDRLDVLRDIDWEWPLESLLGYQISPSRSIWLYSPVLLLSLWGAWQLFQRGQWRIVIALIVAIVTFSLWYGIALRYDWWGGQHWGPRYFVPLLPVLMLWLLPVIEKAFTRRWLMAVLLGLSLLGACIQLAGMSEPPSNYYTDMHLDGKLYGFTAFDPDEWHWATGNWSIADAPLVYHLSRIDPDRFDVAWNTVAGGEVMLLLLGAAVIIFVVFLRWGPAIRGAEMIPVVLVCVLSGASLITLRDDPRYRNGIEDVAVLVEDLEPVTGAEHAVFLDRVQYLPPFMNSAKSPGLVVALPVPPGESFGPGTSSVPADAPLGAQAGVAVTYALDWTATRYDALWLVASSSPFEPEKRRPIEHYLAMNYFPVLEISTSPQARAIRFDPTPAPAGDPSTLADAAFGEHLWLEGYDLPDGTRYHAGNVLPISFVWEVSAPLDFDYNIGLFLLDASGRVTAERNAVPQGTFGRMTTWTPDTTYRDNHGLLLPETLIPGDYRLVVAVYNWQNQARLPVVLPSGQAQDNLFEISSIQITR
ncbi:MAG: hypothetical protein GYB66_16605 [Chloroflexi bacterium]|nr:hypothetical protein [Chloroflexota bacterium]